MSHLACGDDPDSPVNDLQAQRFSEFRAQARDAGVEFEIAHLCNSPAAMTRPDLAYDMVRPGIAVYGQTPIPTRGDMGLRPAMTLKCPVALVRSIKAGDGVSYGHTWIADRDTTVALLPIGYADGVFRCLSGRIDVDDQRAAAPQRRTHLHGPVRRRPRAGIRSTSPRVTTPSCSVPATARRADRAGLGRTARHHQLRGGDQPARPGHPGLPRRRRHRCDGREPLSDDKSREPVRRVRSGRWLAGAAGLAAVGGVVGVFGRALADAARHRRRSPPRGGLRTSRRRPQLRRHDARRRAAGGSGGRPRGRAADGGVRARLLSSHGRLPLSARPADRAVGPAGPDGVLRPARARAVRRRAARVVHRPSTRPGSGGRAGGDGPARTGRARRALDGWHDGARPRPPVSRSGTAPGSSVSR